MEKKVAEETSATKTGQSGVSSCLLICWLEVPAVQVKCHHAEVFREKRTCITINEESESGPLGKYL